MMDELDLPDNIFAKPHQPCQFPVICLGTKEFAWVNMSRTYSYEDGDKGGKGSSTSGMSTSFKLGLFLTSIFEPNFELVHQYGRDLVIWQIELISNCNESLLFSDC